MLMLEENKWKKVDLRFKFFFSLRNKDKCSFLPHQRPLYYVYIEYYFTMLGNNTGIIHVML